MEIDEGGAWEVALVVLEARLREGDSGRIEERWRMSGDLARRCDAMERRAQYLWHRGRRLRGLAHVGVVVSATGSGGRRCAACVSAVTGALAHG